MSGLLVKDFRTLMNQQRYILTILGIFVILMIAGNTSSFMIGYVTFVMMFFTMSTIAYDEADNGYAFLFTLPVRRKDYVGSKFIFGMLSSALFWLIAVVVTLVYRVVITNQLVSVDEMTVGEFMMIAIVLLLASWIMMAIFMPIELKCGVEKGRMVMLIIWGALFAGLFILSKSAADLNIDVAPFVDRLNAMSPVIIVITVLVVTVIIMVLSMWISAGIMEKKEF